MTDRATSRPLALALVAALLATAAAFAQTAPPEPAKPAEVKAAGPAATPAEAKPAKKDDKAASTALEGVFKDGFTLRTPDKKSELKLQGSVQLDSRAYGGDSVAPASFDIRRARIDFNARLYDFIAIRIQAAMEDSPYIRNAFLDIGATDAFHLRVGQMKVPFSSQWLTLDNQVDFIERGSAEPVYPFFDRGMLAWGTVARGTTTYSFGIFNGTGVDLDTNKGDIDDHKDVVARLFLQPFKNAGNANLQGLYVVGQGTYALTSAPTRRFETRGLVAADYESLLWRWRTEQMIGTNGRNTDQISGDIASRTRVGAELNYLNGPFTASAEWARVHYSDIAVYHDFFVGSKRVKHDKLLTRSGDITNISVWGSFFLTGEKKILDNFGWRQPAPNRPYWPGNHNRGAWEVLARFSRTTTDARLFDTQKVAGYTSATLGDPKIVAVGDGGSVTAAVLDGAPVVDEATVGVNWTVSYHLRIQLDVTALWAPDFANGVGGIVSGGGSELADPVKKNRIVEREHMAGLRFIFRI